MQDPPRADVKGRWWRRGRADRAPGSGRYGVRPAPHHPSSQARMPPLLTAQLAFLGLTPAGWCPQRAWNSRAGRAAFCVQASSCGSARQALPAGPASGLNTGRELHVLSRVGWLGRVLPPPPGLGLARVQLPAGPGCGFPCPPLPILFSPPFPYSGGRLGGIGRDGEFRPGSFPLGPESRGALQRGAGQLCWPLSQPFPWPRPLLWPFGHVCPTRSERSCCPVSGHVGSWLQRRSHPLPRAG